MAVSFWSRGGAVTSTGVGTTDVGTTDIGTTCASYAPGHQMHYLHQGQALRSPSERARHVRVDGDDVIVVRESGERLVWRHHDTARLAETLSLFPTSRTIYLGFHALRLGPYWFNCADGAFEPCNGSEGDAP